MLLFIVYFPVLFFLVILIGVFWREIRATGLEPLFVVGTALWPVAIPLTVVVMFFSLLFDIGKFIRTKT